MNWLHVWVWLRFWCLLHSVLLSFVFVSSFYFYFLLFTLFRSPTLYFSFYIMFLLEFISHIFYVPSLLQLHILLTVHSDSFLFNNLFLHHLRRSQSLMNCWLDSSVTRRPSAQWLPSSHADANFTVQLGCGSLCHHPGGRVLGMLGRVIPPACASCVVSLVGSILEVSSFLCKVISKFFYYFDTFLDVHKMCCKKV